MMRTSLKKPPVQYGKRGQRTALIRRDSVPTSKQELINDDDDADVDTTDADSLVKSARKVSLKSKATPPSPAKKLNRQRSATITLSPTQPTLKGKERASSPEDDMDVDLLPRRPSTLVSKLKRKAAMTDSSGLESDDPMLLVETPRKRSRGLHETTPSAARTPSRPKPYVEVISPKVLFAKKPTPVKAPSPPSKQESPLKSKSTSIFDAFESPNKSSSSGSPSRTPTLRPTQSLTKRVGGRAPTKPSDKKIASPKPKEAAKAAPAPAAPTRDWSSIFPDTFLEPSIPTSTSPRKPAGIARRMLARTRTDPIIESASDLPASSLPSTPGPSVPNSPSPIALDRTVSLPTYPIQTRNPDDTPPKPSRNDPREESPGPTRPAARTYAKTRSFLVELTDTILSEDPESQNSQVRESYKELTQRWGLDHSDDGPNGSGLVASELRTVTEMRNKGETRRFLDELGYLFEGLGASQPLSVRRSSAIEFLGKMVEPDFIRKARAADVYTRAWTTFREAGGAQGDVIMEVVMLAFAALVAREARDISSLSEQEGFEQVICNALRQERKADVLTFQDNDYSEEEAKRAGIGKPERKMLQQIHEVVVESEALPSFDALLSCHLLASQAITSLSSSKLNSSILQTALTSLVQELRLSDSRILAFTKALPLSPPSSRDAPDLRHVINCLKVLEHCLFGQWGDEARELVDQHTTDLAHRLISLGVYSELTVLEENEDTLNAVRLFSNVFQMLITFCESPSWASAVMDSPWSLAFILRTAISPLSMPLPIPAPTTSSAPPSSDVPMDLDGNEPPAKTESPDLQLDIMCYALALLTNILQNDERCAEMVGSSVATPVCKRQRTCMKACHCTSRSGGLKCLVDLYEKQRSRENEEDNPQLDFLQGHLAVMLGFLFIHPPNQKPLLVAFPGSSSADKLDSLTVAVKDFMNLHAKVTARMASLLSQSQMQGNDEDDAEMTDEQKEEDVHLSSVALAGSLHSGQKDYEAVNAVVAKLEKLRDTLD